MVCASLIDSEIEMLIVVVVRSKTLHLLSRDEG